MVTDNDDRDDSEDGVGDLPPPQENIIMLK